LSETLSKVKAGFKYVYLVAFFTLLAGFFHPLITGGSSDGVISGVLVLFVGLAGGVLLYKSATSEKRREIYLGAGLGLIAISFALIFQMTGRV
jgi:peptidoglycan/LPS O-acetylase OafA/YrhL